MTEATRTSDEHIGPLDRLRAVRAQLSRIVVGDGDDGVAAALAEVVRLAVAALPGSSGASLRVVGQRPARWIS